MPAPRRRSRADEVDGEAAEDAVIPEQVLLQLQHAGMLENLLIDQ